jgi:hypothetical protein
VLADPALLCRATFTMTAAGAERCLLQLRSKGELVHSFPPPISKPCKRYNQTRNSGLFEFHVSARHTIRLSDAFIPCMRLTWVFRTVKGLGGSSNTTPMSQESVGCAHQGPSRVMKLLPLILHRLACGCRPSPQQSDITRTSLHV